MQKQLFKALNKNAIRIQKIKKQDIEKKKRTQCERNSVHKQYA